MADPGGVSERWWLVKGGDRGSLWDLEKCGEDASISFPFIFRLDAASP
jgi:hypothetical protein